MKTSNYLHNVSKGQLVSNEVSHHGFGDGFKKKTLSLYRNNNNTVHIFDLWSNRYKIYHFILS